MTIINDYFPVNRRGTQSNVCPRAKTGRNRKFDGRNYRMRTRLTGARESVLDMNEKSIIFITLMYSKRG